MGNQQFADTTTAAADRFLALLDDDQRKTAGADFADDAARRDWHYIPRRRPGLRLADMSAVQQKAAIDLLCTGLTPSSFATACLVMALEDVLDAREGGSGPRRGRTGPWGRHRAEYSVIVFGTPGDPAWGWRFEGHHVSTTVTVVDGELATTPQFLGANPASVPDAYRLLAPEQDLALALLDAMDEDERATAIVSNIAPADILTTNAPTLESLPPDEGVVLGDLSKRARTAAYDLVFHYDRRLRVTPALREIDALRFVFAGAPVAGEGQYYRVQGTDLLIEYDNTQDGANHIHTVVRDPAGDFGDDLLRRHLTDHHAHDR